ncbi:MAG: 4Fe-4S dicluster domain-containing protein [Planctomycetota bacterium]|jgi:ferredoxin
MCEFCTKHGEGKKWYLQMKNYSQELLHEELSARQQGIVDAETRLEWNNRFWRGFVMPAMSGEQPSVRPFTEPPGDEPAEREIVEHCRVQHFGQVIPIEDAEKVIDMVDSVTRIPCGCRYLTTGKTDRRYCLGLGIDKWGILGKFPDDSASLEVLEKEEAKRILREYDKEGLIHSIWTGVTPYIVGLCNCDRDCGAYKKYIEMRGAPCFFRGEYVCQVDLDSCTGCKSCFKQCQFGALFYSSTFGKVYIDPTRCFGCGLCRAVCPKDAIELIPRQENPEAADLWLRDKAI